MELEGQISALQSSLTSALSDVETHKELAGQLAQEKSLLEIQLRETVVVMSKLQSEQQAGESVLGSLRADVSMFCVIPAQISDLSIFCSLPPQRLLHTARTSLFRAFMPKSKY